MAFVYCPEGSVSSGQYRDTLVQVISCGDGRTVYNEKMF